MPKSGQFSAFNLKVPGLAWDIDVEYFYDPAEWGAKESYTIEQVKWHPKWANGDIVWSEQAMRFWTPRIIEALKGKKE